MINLFPDQELVVEQIRGAYRKGHMSPLLVAPCGFGKTVVFCYICNGAVRLGNSVLILVHRQELIDQTTAMLNEFGVQHGVIAAGYPFFRGMPVYVASVLSLVRRPFPINPSLIIIDEAHRCTPTTAYGKVLALYPRARRLGVTATPTRLSGEGLDESFDLMIVGPDPEDLIAMGRLSPLRVFAPPTISLKGIRTRAGDYVTEDLVKSIDKPTIVGEAIDHYRKHANGKKGAAFCCSVEHAKHVANDFRNAGIPSMSIDGSINREARRRIITEFRQGKIRLLTSCDLVSEGFDMPDLEVGISLRPTKSKRLWIQQSGRLARVSPGKEYGTLIDHTGNVIMHGLPTEKHEWSLHGTKAESSQPLAKNSLRVCPMCFSAQKSTLPVCLNPSCNYEFPVASRIVAKQNGVLVEMTAEEIAIARRKLADREDKQFKALVSLGKKRGYKDPEGWATHVFEGMKAKKKA